MNDTVHRLPSPPNLQQKKEKKNFEKSSRLSLSLTSPPNSLRPHTGGPPTEVVGRPPAESKKKTMPGCRGWFNHPRNRPTKWSPHLAPINKEETEEERRREKREGTQKKNETGRGEREETEERERTEQLQRRRPEPPCTSHTTASNRLLHARYVFFSPPCFLCLLQVFASYMHSACRENK